MAGATSALCEQGGQPLYITGYFSERALKGDVPDYGYPANHVPATTGASMTVKTGYIVALKSK